MFSKAQYAYVCLKNNAHVLSVWCDVRYGKFPLGLGEASGFSCPVLYNFV